MTFNMTVVGLVNFGVDKGGGGVRVRTTRVDEVTVGVSRAVVCLEKRHYSSRNGGQGDKIPMSGRMSNLQNYQKLMPLPPLLPPTPPDDNSLS